ncbi:unnamed protein product [Urochloa decumbens]|uniref:Uncharacterized protein n=1 Tax=Urochloa decumbens TaxID=240449 RepID=A0ABC9DM00_9POAL
MASSSTSRGSWSGEYGSRRSPIPYRIGPLDYEPPVLCHCGRKAALWISWSDDHPGRRYLKCYRAREGGCCLLRWYDGPCDPFVRTLLVDLRDAVWALKSERTQLRSALADALMKLEQQKKETADALMQLEQNNREALALQVEKVQKPEKGMRLLLCLSVVVAVVVFFMRLG